MNPVKLPYISVVVCAFNEEKRINSCLCALSEQTLSDDRYEVLIIDDESTDNTFSIVSDYINNMKDNNDLQIRLARIRHGGLSMARNTGIQQSKGEIIAFIDGDAVADKNWLAELLKAWEFEPDADAIGGKIEILNPESKTAQFFHSVYYDPSDMIGIIGANMSFRKKTLLQAGGFGDPFISRGDETFLLYKIGSDRREAKWPAALVLHERPTSVRQWLKERIANGEMSRLISRILADNKSLCTAFLIRRAFVVALFAGAAVGLSWKLLWGILLLQGLSLLKESRRKSYKRLSKNHSCIEAVMLTLSWHLLAEVGIWMFCLGRWRGRKLTLERERALHGTVSEVYKTEETSAIVIA